MPTLAPRRSRGLTLSAVLKGLGAPDGEPLLARLSGRRGHFRLESGHHGELWFDLERLFVRPRELQPLAAELAARLAGLQPEVVCGPLLGGALLAHMIAGELGCEFAFAEPLGIRQGPGLYRAQYRIPAALQEVVRGHRVAVVDDAISAGSSVRATLADLRRCGAMPVALAALLVLGQAGADFAESQGLPLESVAQLPHALWRPEECPLCAAGMPLEDRA